MPVSPKFARLRAMLTLVTLPVALCACLTRPVTVAIPAAKCSELVPAGMRAAVPGTPLPDTDTVPAWAAFATAEAAGRVIANQRKADALAVIEACEKREGEIAQAVRR